MADHNVWQIYVQNLSPKFFNYVFIIYDAPFILNNLIKEKIPEFYSKNFYTSDSVVTFSGSGIGAPSS